MGWCADNHGRKRVLSITLTVIICVVFVSVFVGNIYAFVACRLLIGLFLYGTYPQMYIMIAEIVGNQHHHFRICWYCLLHPCTEGIPYTQLEDVIHCVYSPLCTCFLPPNLFTGICEVSSCERRTKGSHG